MLPEIKRPIDVELAKDLLVEREKLIEKRKRKSKRIAQRVRRKRVPKGRMQQKSPKKVKNTKTPAIRAAAKKHVRINLRKHRQSFGRGI